MSDTLPATAVAVARQQIEKLGQKLPVALYETQTRHDKEDFSFRPLRRHFFDRCVFDGCQFDRAAGTGARWLHNQFLGCRFVGVDMEFADFSGTVFAPNTNGSPTTVLGSGFNATVMRDTFFKSIHVEGSSFAQSDFTNAQFVDCEIANGTYEGSLFNNAILENVSFANANIEFVDFTGVSFRNTRLPLMQLAYVFGVSLDQLRSEQVQVSTGDEKPPLSYEDLYEILPALLTYYTSNNEFFALANLALMRGDDESLKDYLSLGISVAIDLKNFRELKYLCRLASLAADNTAIISRGVLKKFYDALVSHVNAANDTGIIQQYSLHDGLIRAYLLEGHGGRLTITFTTSTDNSIEAQRSVSIIAEAIRGACSCIGVDLEFLETEVNTYSNARARLKVSIKSIKLPGFTYTRVDEYDRPIYSNDHASNTPWHSQAIYMAIVVTTSVLITGVNFALNALDHIDSGSELRKHIEKNSSHILKLHEPLDGLVESGTLTFSEGIRKIAEVRGNTLVIFSTNTHQVTADTIQIN